MQPDSGRILGVSLLTANREASGHGVWIDKRTLETFNAQLTGRPLKAYVTHGWGDPTLNEVGLWSQSRIDEEGTDPQLRADFASLDAWKKHSPAEFDTLFELAAKAPTEFGASLSFRFSLAWVRKDGTELATQPSWRATPGKFERVFEPPAPSDAVRAMPSVRAIEVYSADFVDTPAANDGLLREQQVDAPAKVIPPVVSQPKPISMKLAAEIYAKFSDHPKRLARALELHKTDEALSLDAIVSKVDHERTEGELAELRAGHATLTKANEDATAKLKAKDTEIAALKEQATKDAETIAAFRKGGAEPVKTGAGGGEGAGDSTMARVEWAKLSAGKQHDFITKGGKLTD